jgi:hypothetical protein
LGGLHYLYALYWESKEYWKLDLFTLISYSEWFPSHSLKDSTILTMDKHHSSSSCDPCDIAKNSQNSYENGSSYIGALGNGLSY